MMYAAIFEITGWAGTEEYIFCGKDAQEIMAGFERVQDLDCLLEMGYANEDEEGRCQLDKLAATVEKYHRGELEPDDLRALKCGLSIGWIRCTSVAEDDAAIDALTAAHPKAWVVGRSTGREKESD